MVTLERIGRPAPPAAVMTILASYDRAKVEAFVEIAIGLLDTLDGDAEAELDDPPEPNGDEKDVAYVEWHTMRGSQKAGPNILSNHEDDEEDDAAEDDDPGGCEHDGREPEDGY